jgi:hypothetical protein
LGDDLLIVGEPLYLAYTEVLKLANMELNETKTFRSFDLIEFAKRYIYKGTEVSPFPLGSIYGTHGDLSSVAVALDNAIAKS